MSYVDCEYKYKAKGKVTPYTGSSTQSTNGNIIIIMCLE